MATTSLPPGFRFHPTDVELVLYYLKRKVLGKPLSIEALTELDLYKFEPWDLPEKSCLRSKDLVWYFFCPRDRKYANGPRTNRATGIGYWKTTGRDRAICNDSQVVGMKKTLIFHVGRAPQGTRTNWVMHEYRLDFKHWVNAGMSQDSYVLCKIFEKSGAGPKNGEQHGAPFREEDWEDHSVDRSFAPVPHPDSGSPSVIVDDEKISTPEDTTLVLGMTCNESSLKPQIDFSNIGGQNVSFNSGGQIDLSNGGDQNVLFNGEDHNVSSNGGDQNVSSNGSDQNVSSNGGDQNVSSNGADQNVSYNGADQNVSSNGADQNVSSNGGDQNDSSNGSGGNPSLIEDVETDSTTSNEENEHFYGQKINNEATCISALLALKTSTSVEDKEEPLGFPEVISKRKTGKRTKKFRVVP